MKNRLNLNAKYHRNLEIKRDLKVRSNLISEKINFFL